MPVGGQGRAATRNWPPVHLCAGRWSTPFDFAVIFLPSDVAQSAVTCDDNPALGGMGGTVSLVAVTVDPLTGVEVTAAGLEGRKGCCGVTPGQG